MFFRISFINIINRDVGMYLLGNFGQICCRRYFFSSNIHFDIHYYFRMLFSGDWGFGVLGRSEERV